MRIKIASLLFTCCALSFIAHAQDDPFTSKKPKSSIVLVSGIPSGSYYQFAKDIKALDDSMITVQTSSGSIDNYQKLMNNEKVDIAFLQYDVLLMARMHDFKSRTHESDKIQVLLPLANEDIHLITKNSSTINSLKDLEGKKIGVGIPSQEGTNVTAGLIKSVTGIKWTDVNISFDSAFAALLNGEIDAMFFVGYAPVKKLEDLVSTFSQVIKLVPIKDDRLSRIHIKSTIAAGTYPWLFTDIQTYSVKSVLAVNTAFESNDDTKKFEAFLQLIKNNSDKLKDEGYPKWKKADFQYKSLDWKMHPTYNKVF